MKRYIKADDDYDKMMKRYPTSKYEYEVVGKYYNREDAQYAKDMYRGNDPIGIHYDGTTYTVYTVDPNTAKRADADEKSQYQEIVKLLLSDIGYNVSNWICTEVRGNYGATLLKWDTPVGKVLTNVQLSNFDGDSYINFSLESNLTIQFNQNFRKLVPAGDGRKYIVHQPDLYLDAIKSHDYNIEQ